MPSNVWAIKRLLRPLGYILIGFLLDCAWVRTHSKHLGYIFEHKIIIIQIELHSLQIYIQVINSNS